MAQANMAGAHLTSAPGMKTVRMGLVLLLSIAMLGIETVPVFAQATQPIQTAQPPDPAMVESQVKKFGVGKSVKIQLVSGELIKGHIRTIGADAFTVRISRKAGDRSVSYAQVAMIKDPSDLEWVLVGALIVIVIILVAKH